MGSEQRRKFDTDIGLVERELNPDLPEHLQDIPAPAWWTDAAAGVNPGSYGS